MAFIVDSLRVVFHLMFVSFWGWKNLCLYVVCYMWTHYVMESEWLKKILEEFGIIVSW